MSLTLTPQNKDYGDANTTPDIKVQVEESGNLEIRGDARIIDGGNNTVKTEHFESKGKYTYSPNLETVWENMEDGASSIQLTVTSYEQIPESPINGSSVYLYLDKTSYSYTGSMQSPTIIGYDSSKMILGGTTSARDVGTYTITVKPKEGYYWSGQPQGVGKYGEISFTWKIVKAEGYVVADGSTIRNNGVGYIFIDNWGDTKVMSFSSPMYTTFKKVSENGTSNIGQVYIGSNFIRVTGYSNGSASVYITASGSDEYADITFRVNILCTVIQIINSLPYQSRDIYYDGTTQGPTWANYDTSKLTTAGGDYKAVSPGTYYLNFAPKSGYQWWDGTTASKPVSWEIKQAYTPPTPVYSNPVDLSTHSVYVSYYPAQYGTITLQNNTSSPITVTLYAGSSRGPFATFNTSATSAVDVWIEETETIESYDIITIRILAGAPTSLIGTYGTIRVEYKNNGVLVGGDSIDVYMS